jgi:hypothetical protein
MGARIKQLVSLIREAKGSFFLSRVAMRLRFDPAKLTVPDSDDKIAELEAACRELGFEIPPAEQK